MPYHDLFLDYLKLKEKDYYNNMIVDVVKMMLILSFS